MRDNHDTVGDDSRESGATAAIPPREILSAAPAAAWAFAFLVLRIFAVSSYNWDIYREFVILISSNVLSRD